MARQQAQQVARAIAELKSFRNGDLGVIHVITCGDDAIPALRSILFEREPSGLYQTRCRAVEALAALRAYDVLIEFLEAEHAIADPVERVGEDAVVNVAALALAGTRDQRVFALLLRLAERPALTGIIGALGAFKRVEAIPALINALEEDASRLTAEAALREIGRSARAALRRAADTRAPSAERESESSARRRRSALKLLAEMDASPGVWRGLRHLVHDKDTKVSALACEIGLARASETERLGIVRRLIELLGRDDWLLREEIEACLRAHPEGTREIISDYLNEIRHLGQDTATTTRTETILRRIAASMYP
jgi:hypothetical protein